MRKVVVVGHEKFSDKIKGFKIKTYLWADLETNDINFRDFDGVVLDFSNYDPNEDIDWYEFEHNFNFESVMDILLERDSFIYIIGDPTIMLQSSSIGKLVGLNVNPIPGTGDSMLRPKGYPKSEFKEYLDKVKKYEYSFDVVDVSDEVIRTASYSSRKAQPKLNILLATKARHIIATEIILESYKEYSSSRTAVDFKSLHNGKLVLLPANNTDFNKKIGCLINIEVVETDRLPDWVNDVQVYGEESLNASIAEKSQTINDLQEEKEKLVEELTDVRKITRVLYFKGKPLEKEVAGVFKSIGVEVIEPEENNATEFRLNKYKFKFAVEVKSTQNNTIGQLGLRQAIDWQNDAFDETGEEHKALLVTSTEYDKPLSDRNTEILPENLTEYAEKRDICVLRVDTLFKAHQLIKQGKLTVDEFIETLNKAKGLVEINLDTRDGETTPSE